MHYMQAHGYTTGPTQRPTAAGLISAAIASVGAWAIIDATRAIDQAEQNLGITWNTAISVYFLLCLLGGVFYGRIFQRTVNDRHGGWLFGIAYGFLLWMIGPVAIAQWALYTPIVSGSAAAGVLAANLAYGLTLGVTYPWIHHLIQRRLYDVFREVQKNRPVFLEAPKQLHVHRAPA